VARQLLNQAYMLLKEAKMAEYVTPLKRIREDAEYALDVVKTEANDLVDAFDITPFVSKVKTLGRESPFTLALAFLAIGWAGGLVLKNKIEHRS
jgi:hypothetical protein